MQDGLPWLWEKDEKSKKDETLWKMSEVVAANGKETESRIALFCTKRFIL